MRRKHLPLLVAGGFFWALPSQAMANDCMEGRKIHAEALSLGADVVNVGESLPLFKRCLQEGRGTLEDRFLYADALYEARRLPEAREELASLLAALDASRATGVEADRVRAQALFLQFRARIREDALPDLKDAQAALDEVQALAVRVQDPRLFLESEVWRGYVLRQHDRDEAAAEALARVVTGEALGHRFPNLRISADFSTQPPHWASRAVVRAYRELEKSYVPGLSVCGEGGRLACIEQAVEVAQQAGDPALVRWARKEYANQMALLPDPDPAQYRDVLRIWQATFQENQEEVAQGNPRAQDELVLAARKMAQAVLFSDDGVKSETAYAVLGVKDPLDAYRKAQDWLGTASAVDKGRELYRRALLTSALVGEAWRTDGDAREALLVEAWSYLKPLSEVLDAQAGGPQLDASLQVLIAMNRADYFHMQSQHNPRLAAMYRGQAAAGYQQVLDLFGSEAHGGYLSEQGWLLPLREHARSRLIESTSPR